MPSPAPKDPPGLTFTFKNVGPVKAAELELGDLTFDLHARSSVEHGSMMTGYGLGI